MKKLAIILLLVGIAVALTTGATKVVAKYKNYLGKTRDWLGNVLPRGFKNNNLGNIRISKKRDWKGKIPIEKNTDGAFEQFEQFRYGTHAMILLLTEYINGGTNTLRKIIYKYAPPSENDSSRYLSNVSSWAGLDLDSKLTPDKKTLQGLVLAMGRVENGKTISVQDFNEGYALLA